MSTLEKLMGEEDFSQEEAIARALRDRKYLFDPLFEDTDSEGEEEEEDNQEEEGTE